MKRIVIFTGAGISAESGISTFRDSGGLWARYRIEDVCTPEALSRNRQLVIDFYNTRRKELLETAPNAGHKGIVELEQSGKYEVRVVTQNIDDLHERAGSRDVLHLHGELRKLRSSLDEIATLPIRGWQQNPDDRHPDGSLLRPFVVFFGESVPMFEDAVRVVETADIFVIIGTSLAVYPAASLVQYIRPEVPVYLIDPASPDTGSIRNPLIHIRAGAAEGVPQLVHELLKP